MEEKRKRTPKRKIVIQWGEKSQAVTLDKIKRRQEFWVKKFKGLYCFKPRSLLKVWETTIQALRIIQDTLDEVQMFHFHKCSQSNSHLGIQELDCDELQWFWLDNGGFPLHSGNCIRPKMSGIFEERETAIFSLEGKRDWVFFVPGFSFEIEEGREVEKSRSLQEEFLDREVFLCKKRSEAKGVSLDFLGKKPRKKGIARAEALERNPRQDRKEQPPESEKKRGKESKAPLTELKDPTQEVKELDKRLKNVVLEASLEEGCRFEHFLVEKMLIEEERPILGELMKSLRLPIPEALEKIILDMF